MYVVEVRHSSEHNLDGKWFPLEYHNNYRAACKAATHFAKPKAYPGRPITVRRA